MSLLSYNAMASHKRRHHTGLIFALTPQIFACNQAIDFAAEKFNSKGIEMTNLNTFDGFASLGYAPNTAVDEVAVDAWGLNGRGQDPQVSRTEGDFASPEPSSRLGLMPPVAKQHVSPAPPRSDSEKAPEARYAKATSLKTRLLSTLACVKASPSTPEESKDA